MAARTLTSGVDNTTFLIDKLAADCGPVQWMREFTQNALDAIREYNVFAASRGENPTEQSILWDFDDRFHDAGMRKISCYDTGTGMTGPQMIQLLNKLSASSRGQGLTANFGVGAKIAAARRSPQGVLYQSWVDGEGAQVLWWRDPEIKQWGLYQWELADGTFAHWAPVDAEDKPTLIGQHGTKVTLLGFDNDDDTTCPPEGAAAPNGWVLKYLNTRYLAFPEGVVVKALDSTSGQAHRRVARGMGPWLADNSELRGVHQLSDARVHWWILSEESRRADGARYAASGHTAALYQGELYEQTSAAKARRRLQEFGITFGASRVVLYVEPLTPDVIPNTARTMLLKDAEELPWSAWAEEFRDDLPQELAAFVDEIGARSLSDRSDDTRKALDPLLSLLRGADVRARRGGSVRAQDGSEHLVAQPEPGTGAGTGGGSGQGASSAGGGAGADPLKRLLQAGRGRQRGERVAADPYPSIAWISAGEGTRDAEDLAGRAGRFVPEANLIQLNADFAFFASVVDSFSERYAGRLPRVAIVAELHHQVELLVTQRVIAMTTMRGQAAWAEDDVARALSEEALTAVVMDVYWLHYSMGRGLGNRHGAAPAKK